MSDWPVVPLSDLVDRRTAKNVDGHDIVMTVSAQHGLVDQETYFQKRVASDDLSGYWVLEQGDFVYNKSASKDAPWGVIARYGGEQPAVVTPLYLTFRAKPGVVDPSYLLMACNGDTFFDSLAGLLREGARAHGALNVRVGEFFAATVPLPPLAEQRRIVDVMAAVDAHLQALMSEVHAFEKMLNLARLLLVTGGTSDGWAERQTSFDDVHRWTQPELLPPGWRAATLSSLFVVRSGTTPSRKEQVRFFDGGTLPWVKTMDLNEGVITATDECVTDEALAATTLRLYPVDSILVAMYGGYAQIGRTGRLGVPAATNQALSVLVDPAEDVLPAFVQEALKAGRARLHRVAASSRKDPNITKKDVENFELPLPPIEEQRRIVETLMAIEEPLRSLRREIDGLRVFRAALLTELLSGEFEIPESYDALLDAALGVSA